MKYKNLKKASDNARQRLSSIRPGYSDYPPVQIPFKPKPPVQQLL